MKKSKSFFLKIQIFCHEVEHSSRSDALQYASQLIQTMGDDFETVQVNRAPIGSLSLKRRSAGISIEETLRQKKYLRVSAMIIAGLLDEGYESVDSDDSVKEEVEEDHEKQSDPKDDTLELVSYALLEEVISIDKPMNITITKLVRKEITAAIYSDDQCWSLLRFRKPDIVKLIDQLAMPPFLFSPSRHRYSKEFSIILLLRRMAYPGRLHDLEIEFGKEHTSLSRSLGLTVNWLLANHGFRINNNLRFWMPYQETFATVVATKTNVPLEFANVNSFLDGTQKSICRPSDGAGRVEDIQNTYYSGYYRKHGFKMQSLMYPNGKIIHLARFKADNNSNWF